MSALPDTSTALGAPHVAAPIAPGARPAAKAAGRRTEFAALSDRMGHLLILRVALALVVVAWSLLRPESLAVAFGDLAALSAAYLAIAAVGEAARRRSGRHGYWILTLLLLLDGLYLAGAGYATGGTASPIRFLVYLHLVAVSLLASYRTGLKIALWHSLLLVVVLYAQAAMLLPAVDVVPGAAIEFDRMPMLNLSAFWLFAIATSLFSALNERELRNRRADLQSIVDVGTTLDDVRDPVTQSRIVLDAASERFGFARGVVLGASGERVLVLASRGTGPAPTAPAAPDAVVRRAWERREILLVARLDPARNPLLADLLPGARGLLVAPMIADGQAAGAIVVEHRASRLFGVERRVVATLGQFAAIAALNIRNAVLLRHVQDLAERDSLTGAANRRTFQQALERTLASSGAGAPDSASRHAGPLSAAPGPAREAESETERVTSVLFIDLDDFKVVNDTLGHAAGDELLVAVTDRICRIVRQSDLVARLGGDEFAILTEDEPLLGRSRAMAERLVAALRAPYALAGRDVVVTASVGIASARDAGGVDDLVRNADVAMYLAKANGKSGFALFDPAMHEALRERHELSVELQEAIDRDQLRLAYQPIVGLEDGTLEGVEALVRWQHPDRGLVMPARFIEIAEETGSILPIGRWVLGEACREVGRWLAEGLVPPTMFVGVNVSAREVQAPGFVDGVAAALRTSGLRPANLVIEITETALLRATPATIATLGDLRALGVRTVIDDFGTGYFSLSHLRQFPVDVIKVAREFVQDDDPASRSSTLAGAVVALGRSLGIATVAEGIETDAQAARMLAVGCAYGQGYLFAAPMPSGEMVAWAASRETRRPVVQVEPGVQVEPVVQVEPGATAVAAAGQTTGPGTRPSGRPGRRARPAAAGLSPA